MLEILFAAFIIFFIVLIFSIINSIPKEDDYEEQIRYLREYKEAKSSGKYNNKIWKNKDVKKN